MGIIRIIGVGDNGAESLNAKTLGQIAEAELLVGAERLLEYFPNVRAEKVAVKANLDVIVSLIRSSSANNIVVLASGDPGFYGIAKYLINNIGKDMVEVVPNLSSVQLAFARIKENWDDAALYSVHGRDMDELVGVVRSNRKIAILTDKVNSPSIIAKQLLGAGLASIRCFVCENLGSPNERITEGTIEELADKEFSPLNVLVLLNESPVIPQSSGNWTIGIPDAEFSQRKPLRGLITKAEIRVVSLSKLRIKPNSIVWDIGAGSGSVSIEAALLAPSGRVFAVERHAEDISIVKKNIEKFGTGNVTVVHGEAPAVLTELPDPNGVFIGGSGGRLPKIIRAVAERLMPDGHVVVNVTTFENLSTAVSVLRDVGLSPDVIQLSVARGKAVANLTRLEALDPIFILSAKKNST